MFTTWFLTFLIDAVWCVTLWVTGKWHALLRASCHENRLQSRKACFSSSTVSDPVETEEQEGDPVACIMDFQLLNACKAVLQSHPDMKRSYHDLEDFLCLNRVFCMYAFDPLSLVSFDYLLGPLRLCSWIRLLEHWSPLSSCWGEGPLGMGCCFDFQDSHIFRKNVGC